MFWYRAQRDGADARELCIADICSFEGDIAHTGAEADSAPVKIRR